MPDTRSLWSRFFFFFLHAYTTSDLRTFRRTCVHVRKECSLEISVSAYQTSCSGISLTLLSWRGSGYKPNSPLFELSTSASAEPGAALWAWRCKTVLVSALATNFSNSIIPDNSFSLSHSFLLIVFFLFCAASIFCSMHALLFYDPTYTHTHARARSTAHAHTFRISHL